MLTTSYVLIHPLLNAVEPLFRGHPREQGKCPRNRGVPEWNMSWGLLLINQQIKYNFSYILPQNLLETLF